MKTIEIKIYKFDELSEQSKQVAISKNCYINVDFDWWESTYKDAERIGLKLESFNLDRNKHATGSFNLSACEVAQNIANDHGDQCQTFKTAEYFVKNWQPVFNDYMNPESEGFESFQLEVDMQDFEDKFLKSLLIDYANILQGESEYLQSDEAIKETIKANDYDFLESGEMY